MFIGVRAIHTSTAILVHWNFNKKRIPTKKEYQQNQCDVGKIILYAILAKNASLRSYGVICFMLVRYNSVFVPLCSPNTRKDVFNPNVATFQSN